eukprot:scaffold43502_cov23-Cyclotella_meneghiniana.AAC.1
MPLSLRRQNGLYSESTLCRQRFHHRSTPSITYSSVVSRDSVRLAFLIAALNELDIMSCDIGNAYLNAPCREKIWFKAGIECGEDKGK